MEQFTKFKFFNITRQLDYTALNSILSLLYLIPIYLGFIILLSALEDMFKFIFIIILALTLLIIRFSISILFGFTWENEHKKISKNYILEFFIIAGVLDFILVIYYVFYSQINNSISSELLSIILLPIIIITVGSLLISGIENVLYSFMLGLISLALFVDPANIHHTMGEFIIMYSAGSTLILSPFYVLPSILIGTLFNKLNSEFLNSKRALKVILLVLIPVMLISIAHIGFYSIVFGNW